MSELTAGWSWLKAHETLLMVILALATVAHFTERWFDARVISANAKVEATTAQVNADKTAAAQAAATTAAAIAQLNQTTAQQAALITQLSIAISQRNTALVQKQTVIKTAPLPEVAATWQTAIGGQGDIISGTTGLTVSDSAARRTVDMLLALPVANANLIDETKISDERQAVILQDNVVIEAQGNQIAGLNKELTDSAAQCKAEVTAVKAEARKSKIRWFKWGFITGFLTGAYVGHAL
jgi:hypothetical protein